MHSTISVSSLNPSPFESSTSLRYDYELIPEASFFTHLGSHVLPPAHTPQSPPNSPIQQNQRNRVIDQIFATQAATKAQIHKLLVQISELTARIETFEQASSEWPERYSRRFAIATNISTGTYTFWQTLVIHFVKIYKFNSQEELFAWIVSTLGFRWLQTLYSPNTLVGQMLRYLSPEIQSPIDPPTSPHLSQQAPHEQSSSENMFSSSFPSIPNISLRSYIRNQAQRHQSSSASSERSSLTSIADYMQDIAKNHPLLAPGYNFGARATKAISESLTAPPVTPHRKHLLIGLRQSIYSSWFFFFLSILMSRSDDTYKSIGSLLSIGYSMYIFLSTRKLPGGLFFIYFVANFTWFLIRNWHTISSFLSTLRSRPVLQ